MTRFNKINGVYVIKGTNYEAITGSRAQVWHGSAYETSGGLTKSQLFKNKLGRIVSKSKHGTAKKEMRLKKHGYHTRKGHFGFVKKPAMETSLKKTKSKSRKSSRSRR
jgi:hypothetical protein